MKIYFVKILNYKKRNVFLTNPTTLGHFSKISCQENAQIIIEDSNFQTNSGENGYFL